MMVNKQKKLSEELKVEFPKMRTPENMANVILAGKNLLALDSRSGKSRGKFVEKGAKSGSVSTASSKYGLLVRRKSPRFRIVVFGREGRRPKEDEREYALHVEMQGLFAHLEASRAVRVFTAQILGLPTDDIVVIKRKLEKGTFQEQVEFYEKVVTNLINRKLYNKNYDYFWVGFRYIPDKYWLSELSKKLLKRVGIH